MKESVDKSPIDEAAEKALEIWEQNIPAPLNELLGNFAMEHTYPVRGIIRNLLSKVIAGANWSPASGVLNIIETNLKQKKDQWEKAVPYDEKAKLRAVIYEYEELKQKLCYLKRK